jgi:hypothetical protein
MPDIPTSDCVDRIFPPQQHHDAAAASAAGAQASGADPVARVGRRRRRGDPEILARASRELRRLLDEFHHLPPVEHLPDIWPAPEYLQEKVDVIQQQVRILDQLVNILATLPLGAPGVDTREADDLYWKVDFGHRRRIRLLRYTDPVKLRKLQDLARRGNWSQSSSTKNLEVHVEGGRDYPLHIGIGSEDYFYEKLGLGHTAEEGRRFWNRFQGRPDDLTENDAINFFCKHGDWTSAPWFADNPRKRVYLEKDRGGLVQVLCEPGKTTVPRRYTRNVEYRRYDTTGHGHFLRRGRRQGRQSDLQYCDLYDMRKNKIFRLGDEHGGVGVKHPAAVGGKKVQCAGHIAARNGKIMVVGNASGHYRPDWYNLLAVVELLEANHAFHERAVVALFPVNQELGLIGLTIPFWVRHFIRLGRAGFPMGLTLKLIARYRAEMRREPEPTIHNTGGWDGVNYGHGYVPHVVPNICLMHMHPLLERRVPGQSIPADPAGPPHDPLEWSWDEAIRLFIEIMYPGPHLVRYTHGAVQRLFNEATIQHREWLGPPNDPIAGWKHRTGGGQEREGMLGALDSELEEYMAEWNRLEESFRPGQIGHRLSSRSTVTEALTELRQKAETLKMMLQGLGSPSRGTRRHRTSGRRRTRPHRTPDPRREAARELAETLAQDVTLIDTVKPVLGLGGIKAVSRWLS